MTTVVYARRRSRRRRAPWGRAVLIVLGLGLVFFLSAGVSLFAFWWDRGGEARSLGALEAEPRPGERVNVLVLGVDSGSDDVRRSDTIMVVSADPITREVGVLSIPRDTLVSIPGRPGRERVGHAHAYGGPERALEAVRSFLGVPIHYYVRVDFRGFEALVDTLGGVTVDVEKRMRYSDPAQGLEIDLAPGRQRLDGQRALQYVRYRRDGDINRIHRQQKFLIAVLQESRKVGTLFRLPRLVRQLRDYVDTDMPAEAMFRLAQLAAGLREEDVQTGIVPTAPAYGPGGAYLGEEADPGGLQARVDRLLLGIDREANGRVAVRVLNGTTVAGLGRRVADALSAEGYRVVEVADGPRRDFRSTAVVYAPGGKGEEAARCLARSLGRKAGTVRLFRARGEDQPLFAAGTGAGGRAEIVIVAGRDLAMGGI